MDADQVSPTTGRLQRTSGKKLTQFREVIIRHGLPGWLLAVALLLPTDLNSAFLLQIDKLTARPEPYLAGGFAILALIVFASWKRRKSFSQLQFLWIGYLLLVSTAEEWIFRVTGPLLLELIDLTFLQAVVLCNLVFGALHYFTLRWKAQWCVMAFLGGMGFSYSFAQHGDLFVIIGIHWLATFFNTPNPPGQRQRQRDE